MNSAFLALHLSILLAGWTGVFGKLIGLTAVIIVWWRLVICGSVMAVTVKTFGLLEKTTTKEKLSFMLLCAVLAYQWMLFYAGIKASNISVGVVSFSTMGFFTAIFEPLLTGARIRVREILFSLVTVLGIYLIFHFDTQYRLGVIYATLSAAGAAAIAVYMKKFRRNHNSETVLTWQFTGGFLGTALILPAYFWMYPADSFWPTLWPDLPYLLIFATVVTLGMYWLQMYSLKHVSAFTVNLSYNLEPVYSVAIAILFLGEAQELTNTFWFGLTLIALSVLMQTACVIRDKRRGL